MKRKTTMTTMSSTLGMNPHPYRPNRLARRSGLGMMTLTDHGPGGMSGNGTGGCCLTLAIIDWKPRRQDPCRLLASCRGQMTGICHRMLKPLKLSLVCHHKAKSRIDPCRHI